MAPAPFAALLLEATRWHAILTQPTAIDHPEDALDAVRGFMRVEEQIRAFPDAGEALVVELTRPLDPSGRHTNHAFMAAEVLARTGWPNSAANLLAVARGADRWCATQARVNLAWLEPSLASTAALAAELELVRRRDATALPGGLIARALAYQRTPTATPAITAYIDGDGALEGRVGALIDLVDAMPDLGLEAAAARQDHAVPAIAGTAIGLRAVFGDEEAFARLCAAAASATELQPYALRWLARIPRPESLPLLERGLTHVDAGDRLDLVTALACFGERRASELVLAAVADPDAEVAEQATNLIISWLGDDPDFLELTSRWEMDARGLLTARSRRDLAAIAQRRLSAMPVGVRHHGDAPLELARVLDHLYRGTLPHYHWYQWVAATGVYGPFGPGMTALYNFPTLEQLEDWYQANGSSLVPGAWSYAGRLVTTPA